MEYYRSSRDYLNDRIGHLKWLILGRIRALVKEERIIPKGRYKKLFTNMKELERITHVPGFGESSPIQPPGKPISQYTDDEVTKAIASAERELAERTEATLMRGRRIALLDLQQMFELSEPELNLVVLGIAAELEPKMLLLYNFICGLPETAWQWQPTIEAFFRVFADTQEKALEYRKYFTLQSPLLQNRLVSVQSVDSEQLRRWTFTVPPSVVNFCIDVKSYQIHLGFFLEVVKPTSDRYLSYYSAELQATLSASLEHYLESTSAGELGMIYGGVQRNGLLVCLKGHVELGQRYLAEAVAHRLNKILLIVDMNRLVNYGDFVEVTHFLFRDARLFDAVILFYNAHKVEEETAFRSFFSFSYLLNRINTFPGVVLYASDKVFTHDDIVHSKVVLKYEPSTPEFEIRKRIWEDELSTVQGLVGEVDTTQMATLFGFHVNQVKGAVRFGVDRCFALRNQGYRLDTQSLIDGSQAQLNKALSYMAKRVKSKLTWDDMILPKKTKDVLDEILVNAKYRQTVLHDWGFKKRLGIGTGIGIMFSGEPGTGKTMAAGIIASQLNKEIYKINISTVVSKWAGETEKQLERVFNEATESQSILLFDEADSLFAKRTTEVESSTDRFSNMMINFLLQKIEEFEGVCILTTNLKSAIDKAFVRRLSYRVEFPFPDEKARAAIWESIIPDEMPKGEEFDYEYLAKKYKMSGGHIKNCLLRASFFALDENSKVTMFHLDKSAQKECSEIGALWDINMESPKPFVVPLR